MFLLLIGSALLPIFQAGHSGSIPVARSDRELAGRPRNPRSYLGLAGVLVRTPACIAGEPTERLRDHMIPVPRRMLWRSQILQPSECLHERRGLALSSSSVEPCWRRL